MTMPICDVRALLTTRRQLGTTGLSAAAPRCLRGTLVAGCAAAAVAVGCDSREPPSSAPDGAGPTQGQAQAETAAPRRVDVALGTFRTGDTAGLEGARPEGRLPADGDRAIYVPATTLFPGAARLDPGIENPYAGDPEAIAAGERHFEAFNCGGCHAPLGGGGMGPPLSDDEWIHGGEPAQIYMSIMHGRPEGMPAWSSMLPRRTVWEMVTYIESLSEIEDYAAHKGFESNANRFANFDRSQLPGADRPIEGRPASAAEPAANPGTAGRPDPATAPNAEVQP
jgi:mono/diheme cytochrome c family protein